MSPENIDGLVDSLLKLNAVVQKVETDVRDLIEDICKSLAPIHPAARNSWILNKVRTPFMTKLELSGLSQRQAVTQWGGVLGLLQHHPESGIVKQIRTRRPVRHHEPSQRHQWRERSNALGSATSKPSRRSSAGLYFSVRKARHPRGRGDFHEIRRWACVQQLLKQKKPSIRTTNSSSSARETRGMLLRCSTQGCDGRLSSPDVLLRPQ